MKRIPACHMLGCATPPKTLKIRRLTHFLLTHAFLLCPMQRMMPVKCCQITKSLRLGLFETLMFPDFRLSLQTQGIDNGLLNV
jgi:hypothetical protein